MTFMGIVNCIIVTVLKMVSFYSNFYLVIFLLLHCGDLIYQCLDFEFYGFSFIQKNLNTVVLP